MDEQTQNDLEEQLRKYIRFINDPNKTEEQIQEQNELLKTFLGVQKQDQMIDYLKNANDINRKNAIKILEEQVENARQEFLEELNNRQQQQEENSRKDIEEVQAEEKREIRESVDDSDNANDSYEKNEAKTVEEIEKDMKEVQEAADEMLNAMEAMNNTKNSTLVERVHDKSLLEGRLRIEQAQDHMNFEMAKFIVEKSILAEKRREIALEIRKEIDSINKGNPPGERLDSLTKQLAECDHQLQDKERTFASQFQNMQAEVVDAYRSFDMASKEVMTKASSSLSNSYRALMNYNQDGIMEKKAEELTLRGHDFQRVVRVTEYSPSDLIANGPQEAASRGKIQVGDYTVTVVSNRGQTKYYMGGTEMSDYNIDENGTTAETTNGELVKTDPPMKAIVETLGGNPDETGPNESFDAAVETIKEKAEEKEKENEEDPMEEYPTYNSDDSDEESGNEGTKYYS